MQTGARQGGLGLIATYRTLLAEETKLRAYIAASFMDDLGIAISVWASQLMLTNVFTDQRARASFMLPTLLCFILGSIVAGPLADWSGRARRQSLAHWRWRVVLMGRVVETSAMLLLVALLWRSGPPTVGRILPYFLVAAFIKTALRPTRMAFEVDLLHVETPQFDRAGQELKDDTGQPLRLKRHLLTALSLLSALSASATLLGLLLGNNLLEVAGGSFAVIFALDVTTNIAFIFIFWLRCRPADEAEPARSPITAPQRRLLGEFWSTLREAWSFLRRPEQRPLLCLLFGGWIIEVLTEFYDGKMVIKHVLGGADDHVRYSQITWSIVSLLVLAALPALTTKADRLGRIFLIAMLLDGVAIAVAGKFASVPGGPVLPFAAALACDRALTDTSGILMNMAQTSACRQSLRGRVNASWAFVVLVSAVFAEGLATLLAESLGIPKMMMLLGAAQVGLMVVVTLAVGPMLWNYGFRAKTAHATSPSGGPYLEARGSALEQEP